MSTRYESRTMTCRVPVAYVCDVCGAEKSMEYAPNTEAQRTGREPPRLAHIRYVDDGHHLCEACSLLWDAHNRAHLAWFSAQGEALEAFEVRWRAEHPEPVWVWPKEVADAG